MYMNSVPTKVKNLQFASIDDLLILSKEVSINREPERIVTVEVMQETEKFVIGSCYGAVVAFQKE